MTKAIVGGRVITMAGQVFDPGYVLLEQGKILAVGDLAEMALSDGAEVIDASGKVVAFRSRIVCQPIAGGRTPVDGPAVAGIADTLYAMPNMLVEYAKPSIGVPVGYWRSVGASQNAFILESFIDELAHAGKRDPVELRREMLASEPRMRAVLELAAEKSGWGTPLPAGRARGIALAEDMGSLVCEVAEVSVTGEKVRVHKVTLAADCGRIMHPGIVEAQLGGLIGQLRAQPLPGFARAELPGRRGVRARGGRGRDRRVRRYRR
jgi:hypothetical protein